MSQPQFSMLPSPGAFPVAFKQPTNSSAPPLVSPSGSVSNTGAQGLDGTFSPWVRGKMDVPAGVVFDSSVFDVGTHSWKRDASMKESSAAELIPSLMNMEISPETGTASIPGGFPPEEDEPEDFLYPKPTPFTTVRDIELSAAATSSHGDASTRHQKDSRFSSQPTSSSLQRVAFRSESSKLGGLSYYDMTSATILSANIRELLGGSGLSVAADTPLGKPLCNDSGMVLIPTQILNPIPPYKNGVCILQVSVDDSSGAVSVSSAQFCAVPDVAHHPGCSCPVGDPISSLCWVSGGAVPTAAVAICNYVAILALNADGWSMSPLLAEYSNGKKYLAGHCSTIRALCAHPSKPQIVASAASNGEIQFWDVQELRQACAPVYVPGTISTGQWVDSGAIDAGESDVFVVCTEQGGVYRVHVGSGRVPIKCVLNRPAMFSSAMLRGNLLVGHGDGRVNVVDKFHEAPKGFWDDVVTAVDDLTVISASGAASAHSGLVVSGYGGLSYYDAKEGHDGGVSLVLRAMSVPKKSASAKPTPPTLMSIYEYVVEAKLSCAALHIGGTLLIVTSSDGAVSFVDVSRFPLPTTSTTSMTIELGEPLPAVLAMKST